MNNPIATSFNKIYINVGSASHITVPKTQLSIVNGKKPNSVLSMEKNPTQYSQWNKTQLRIVNGKNSTQYSQWKKTNSV